MEALRRSTITAVAACATVAAGLWLLFGVVLEPTRSGCNTSLIDGPYRDAMAPVHVAAAALLSWAIWQLDAATQAAPRATRRALVAVWVVIAIGIVVPGVIGLIAFVAAFAGVLVGLPALVALAIGALVTLRARERWPKYASMATLLAWGCLLLGLPTSVAYVWLEGATPFCF